MKTKFQIIIVHYKNCEDTYNCINSLLHVEYSDYEIVVVDNSENYSDKLDVGFLSTGDAREMQTFNLDIAYAMEVNIDNKLNSAPIKITLLKTDNRGFASANNLGFKYLNLKNIHYDWLWFLNNDTEVESDILAKIDNKIRNGINPRCGILGNDIFRYHDRNKLQGIGGRIGRFSFGGQEVIPKQYDENTCIALFESTVEYVIGASMFVRRQFIEDVGPMNEAYFLFYEEIDWAIRGQKKGWEIDYCFGAKVYHKEGATIGTGAKSSVKSDLADYYGIRSKILFVKYYYPQKKILLLFSLCISFWIRIFHGYFRRAFRIFSLMKFF